MIKHAPDIDPSVRPTHETGYDEVHVRNLEADREAKIAVSLGEQAAQAYFHGTNYRLNIGDKIVPGTQGIIDADGTLHASATTWEEFAWNHSEDRAAEHGGRARVYEVVPTDGQPVKNLGPQYGEVNSPSFTVIGEVDMKPGRQGTLPDINWAKDTLYTGANHPEDPPYVYESIPNFNYVEVDPNEVALPGLDDAYVEAELDRIRVAKGRPRM